ncbi:hypothetical protein Golomagni_04621 [Golovinomyces magnicellulatus]|nr:hypothetical protein Golomagni_04621 [Golovinomyces magnicellulatus]
MVLRELVPSITLRNVPDSQTLARPTVSQAIINQFSSTWSVHKENITHQILEPNGIKVNFKQAQIIGRSHTPLFQPQPKYKGKNLQFEDFLSRSDFSNQSETIIVSTSGNTVDCCMTEYLLYEQQLTTRLKES